MTWKITAALSALALVAGSAQAADMAVKARPAPVVAYSWTGCYVGANAGAGWGRSRISSSTTGIDQTVGNYNATLSTSGSPTLDDTNFVAGGQAGCNYQVGQFVIGVEGDIDWNNYSVSRVTGAIPTPIGTTITFGEFVKTDWLATVRGRAGFAADRWFFYGTGGWAGARETFTQNLVFGPATLSLPGSVTSDRSGWTAGVGVEYAFAGNWTAKLEYLYVDLGTLSFTNVTPNGSVYTHNNRLEENIVRAGINYKFGPAAVVAKY